MNERPPSALEHLWGAGGPSGRGARLGLSVDRIVESAVELADRDGMGAVSMKAVAENLGFTTMSLYRYVSSKDELLLLMHDTCWRPPSGLEVTTGIWRDDLASWTREQYDIILRHPWLEQVRHIDRAGTPSQVTWLEFGLRTLAGTALEEYQKIDVLLVLSGYVFATARNAVTVTDGLQRGYFAQGQAASAFAQLLAMVAGAERFPALVRCVQAGGFPDGRPFPDMESGLALILDGVARLIERQAA
jgi:AcrR family transcriptional regulator